VAKDSQSQESNFVIIK